MTKTVALLPCPFCSGKAERADKRLYHCSNPECLAHHYEQDEQGGFNHDFESKDAAIAAWNTRASTRVEQPELVERIDAIISKQRDQITAMEAEHGGGIPDDQCGVVLNFRDLIDLRAAIEATRTQTDRQLREEVERLRGDRARYQWLADAVLCCDYGDNDQGGAESPDRIGWAIRLTRRNAEPFIFGQSIDAAIDAARTQARSSLSSSSLTNG